MLIFLDLKPAGHLVKVSEQVNKFGLEHLNHRAFDLVIMLCVFQHFHAHIPERLLYQPAILVVPSRYREGLA